MAKKKNKESTFLTITHDEFQSLLHRQIEVEYKMQETTIAMCMTVKNHSRKDGRDRPADETGPIRGMITRN